MPSPSKLSLITGLAATVGVVWGGAYLASLTPGKAPDDAGEMLREEFRSAPAPSLDDFTGVMRIESSAFFNGTAWTLKELMRQRHAKRFQFRPLLF